MEIQKDKDVWETVFSCPAKISEAGTTVNKTEGDGKTPEGSFNVLFCIGTNNPKTALRYIGLTNGDVWVDDSNSKYYNTLQKNNMSKKDWNSAEDIFAYFSSDPGTINNAIFFDYNGDGETPGSASAGAGSVLFIFGRSDYNTAISKSGDIYISANDMTTLLSYLDKEKNPVFIIQASKTEDSAFTSTGTTSGVKYSYVDELMVRTGQGVEYTAIDKINTTSAVNVIDENGDWTHINYNGQEAWVSSQYLTELKPEFILAVRYNYNLAQTAIQSGFTVNPQYRGEDNDYVYCQVYWGGGWHCVKVRKDTYTVEEMTDAERARYEINPYANTGSIKKRMINI